MAIASTCGFVLFVLVYVLSPLSGGHLNPAVSLGLAVSGKVTVVRACLYAIAQCAGAVGGTAVAARLHPPTFDAAGGAVNGSHVFSTGAQARLPSAALRFCWDRSAGTPALPGRREAAPAEESPMRTTHTSPPQLTVEFIGTVMLLLTVFTAVDPHRAKSGAKAAHEESCTATALWPRCLRPLSSHFSHLTPRAPRGLLLSAFVLPALQPSTSAPSARSPSAAPSSWYTSPSSPSLVRWSLACSGPAPCLFRMPFQRASLPCVRPVSSAAVDARQASGECSNTPCPPLPPLPSMRQAPPSTPRALSDRLSFTPPGTATGARRPFPAVALPRTAPVASSPGVAAAARAGCSGSGPLRAPSRPRSSTRLRSRRGAAHSSITRPAAQFLGPAHGVRCRRK